MSVQHPVPGQGPADVDDWGCCALDDGHDGRCAWLCSGCQGGRCPECHGTGGPDDVVRCDWCEGSAACPEGCSEGWVTDEP
jgi:hypothetical protein